MTQQSDFLEKSKQLYIREEQTEPLSVSEMNGEAQIVFNQED